MPAHYIYTRIRPLDLLQVSNDQGAETTLSAAIAAIQANGNMTHICPKCQDQGGNPTGWNTIPITGSTATVICTVCEGFLKTVQTFMPDPNKPGNYIALVISGGVTVVAAQTLQLVASVVGGVWSSSDQTKATINAQNGLATGVAAGTSTITYTVGNYSTTLLLTVTNG